MIWIFFLALITSFVLTWVLKIHAVRANLMDYPNERSSHTAATPRGGGLAIVLILLGASLVLYALEKLPVDIFFAVTVAGGVTAGIGYWDDRGHIPARWRILVHISAALMALYWLFDPGWSSFVGGSLAIDMVGYLLGTGFLVWMLNLFNFMDGIDGIAGIESAFVSGGASFLTFTLHTSLNPVQNSVLILQLTLAAASLGFLFWNWSPARVFMGDVGSGFLGFILGVFALINALAGMLPLWCWLILSSVFLVDATVTLFRRFLRGARWYEAHRSHAYQHASRKWNSHRKVSLAVLGINLVWLLPLAWLATLIPEHGWLIMVVAMAPLVAAALKLGAGIEDKPDTKDARSVI